MRPITVKYQGKCRKCGVTLAVGEQAIYERYVGLFCPACEPKDTDEIRHYRQEARDEKAERYEDWAAKRREKAKAQLNSYPQIRRDIAFITQPGHIPFRNRMNRADNRAFESLSIARSMEDKAERLHSKPAVKGDAEKRWQGLRDLNLSRFKVGDVVNTGIYGTGKIQKINKKSVIIEHSNNAGTFKTKVDIAFLSPVSQVS